MIHLKQNPVFIKIKSSITGFILLIALLFLFSGAAHHPIYVSVTEIEHNAKENSLEISCKIFTSDLEAVLRKNNKNKVDLLAPTDKKAMEALVSNYIQQHLKIIVNEKPVQLSFVGYEQNEETIQSYFQVNEVKSIKSMEVLNNILYEYKSEQISIIHVIIDGKRKSTKLNNPEDRFKPF
jgi:exo-beta-1,3-glucanase (GH17 family)